MASIGEAIERYCASIEPEPERINCNSIKEFNIQRITRASLKYDQEPRRKWTVVQEVGSLKKVLVPRELVYLLNTDYPPIRDIISTGLATYSTLNGAIIRGLCECIERDAFILFWMLSCINFKIDNNTIDQKEIKILLNKAQNSGLQVELYDISTEFGVPVILTVTRKKGKEGFYLSCAANFDYDEAIRKSLEEGLGGYSVYTEATLLHKMSIPPNLNKIKNLSERPIYYLNNNKDRLLRNIIERSNAYGILKNYKCIKKKQSSLEQVIEALNNQNINVFFKDITTSDVKELGFRVVRVITPELAFLPIGKPMLYCNRLIQKAEELNRELNLEPHPFP